MGIFSKKNFQCLECVEKFEKRDDLFSHGQTVHNQTIKNCPICNTLSLSPQPMLEHTKEKHNKVKVGWQLFFMFVPIVGIWAYYRIKKLQSGILLSLGLTALMYGVIFLMVIIGFATDPNSESDLTTLLLALSAWPFMGIMIWLKIRYMIKWSREWNKKIDTQIESLSKQD